MAASLYRLPDVRPGRPLRLALAAGAGPEAEAVVRAYFPPPHEVVTGAAGGAADAALAWWPAPARLHRPEAGPLVALCTGGLDTLAAALDAGADYALALPVTPALLRAVCRAWGRRADAAPSAPPPGLPFALDRRARTLAVGGRPVPLTLREFDLLAYLADRAGACCSRDEILADVWGIDFETGTNTIDVFIYALRRKLRAAELPGLIQTVRGAGYRLDP